jgi:hypothetical protein
VQVILFDLRLFFQMAHSRKITLTTLKVYLTVVFSNPLVISLCPPMNSPDRHSTIMFQPLTRIVCTMAVRIIHPSIAPQFFGLGNGCIIPAPPRGIVLHTHVVVGEDLFLCRCIGLFLSLSVDCFMREEVDAVQISCT